MSKQIAKKFQQTIENFICENCQLKVVGNGYTNHCPNCLWSKHVDIFPGDRLELCLGLMKPLKVELKSGQHRILHQCLSCQFLRRNNLAKTDNYNSLLEIIKNSSF